MGTYPKTPALNKLRSVKADADRIARFLEWAEEQGWEFCKFHQHDEGCRDEDGRLRACGIRGNERFPINLGIEKILALYLEVDLEAVEREKRAILDHISIRP